MGFLDRFRRKKEEEEETEKSLEKINIVELAGWLTTNLNLKDLQDRSKEFYERILASFIELNKLNNKLEKAEFESGDKTYASANMVKNAFVKKTNSIVSSLGFSASLTESKITYMFMMNFHSSVLKSVKEIKSLTPKQAVLLSNYFKMEARPVMEKINNIDRHINDLGTFLEAEGKKMQLIDDLTSRINDYHSLVQNLESLKQRKRETNKRIEELEKSDTETEISRTKQIPRWIEFEALEKELKTNKERISDIGYNIKEQLSGLAKPFKKLDYLTSRNLIDFSFSKDTLRNFLSKPFDSFIEEHGDASLKKLIEDINKMVDGKKISLKEREKQKLKDLNKALDRQLKELREIYLDAKNKNLEKGAKIRQYADIIEKKQQLEDRFIKEREELFELKNEIKLTDKKILEAQERISNLKEETENQLFEETGNKIELILN